jgi:hypothetical protein
VPITPKEYAQAKALVALLKKRFPNLTTDETLALAFDIMSVLENVGREYE